MARVVEEAESLYFVQSSTLSSDVIPVWITNPAFTVPDLHRGAALSRHPASDQEAANLIEMH